MSATTRPPRFICDVHLGKAAKLLRLLGFDTLYRNTYTAWEIVRVAEAECRIILTRDRGLLKRKNGTSCLGIRATNAREQIREVVKACGLRDRIRPFSRCLICNTPVIPVSRHEALTDAPPRVRGSFTEFCRCPGCGRLYWPGSHYRRMEAWIAHICASGHSSSPDQDIENDGH